jgi:hypothetical protein
MCKNSASDREVNLEYPSFAHANGCTLSLDRLLFPKDLKCKMSDANNVSYFRSLEVDGRGNCNFSYSLHIRLISFKIIHFVGLGKIAHSSSVLAKVEQNTWKRMCRKQRCFLLHSGCLLLHFLNCYLGLFIAPKWYFFGLLDEYGDL